jgi:2-keto-4-pentenoate hydratase
VAPAFESASSELRDIGRALVAARLAARPLAAFPGRIPASLDAAYQCQDFSISLWPDTVAGWKVGWIPADWQVVLGEERLVGPVFAHEVVRLVSGQSEIEMPVYAGGFAAIEAEYVLELGRDAPADKHDWTRDEAARYVAGMYVGVEIASSPLESINRLGPPVVVSDFGNNAGLVLGPAIDDWRNVADAALTCHTLVDGIMVGRGGAASLPGGPLGALAFALGRCARGGRPLRTGQLVTTGASTGIHDIRPGQSGTVVFDGLTSITCHAIPRQPMSAASMGAAC